MKVKLNEINMVVSIDDAHGIDLPVTEPFTIKDPHGNAEYPRWKYENGLLSENTVRCLPVVRGVEIVSHWVIDQFTLDGLTVDASGFYTTPNGGKAANADASAIRGVECNEFGHSKYTWQNGAIAAYLGLVTRLREHRKYEINQRTRSLILNSGYLFKGVLMSSSEIHQAKIDRLYNRRNISPFPFTFPFAMSSKDDSQQVEISSIADIETMNDALQTMIFNFEQSGNHQKALVDVMTLAELERYVDPR